MKFPIRFNSKTRHFNIVDEDQIFAVIESSKLESVQDAANSYWIQAWRFGEWDHPKYGKEIVDEKFADDMISNFQANVFGQDLPFDYEHGLDPAKGLQAAAWVRDMQKREDGVYYLLEFTEDAMGEIKGGKWRYVSPSYKPKYRDDSTGQIYLNVPTGGGITNRPYFKGMLPLNFSELVLTQEDKDSWAKDWLHSYNNLIAEVEKERKESSMDPNELLRKFATILGVELPEKEFSEEAALKAASDLAEIIKPMREAQENAGKTRTFREQFPAEYDRMIALEAAKIATDAREFAATYERFTIKEDDKEKQDTRGFSSLVLSDIENVHKKFSEGSVDISDLGTLLDHISSGGIVDYKEYGSSRSADNKFAADLDDKSDVKKQFSALVAEVMTEDAMEYDKAVTIAATRDPKLFEAYMSAPTA